MGTRRDESRRALGQHFLVDPEIVERLVVTVGATPDDVVGEIGAGEGVLTRRLASRAGRVVAIEIDPALHARLAATGQAWPTLDLRLADARRFPYPSLSELVPAPAGRVLVAGNLPYSVSKPILQALFEARAALDSATLMLQREVAERLVAPPGGRVYGALSVLWQLWADLALCCLVPPDAFRPPPAVESAVIHARFRRAPRVAVSDPARFARVVKAAFAQRRKTLENALRAAGHTLGGREVRVALAAAGIDGRRRAETLTLDEFARLTQAFTPDGA